MVLEPLGILSRPQEVELVASVPPTPLRTTLRLDLSVQVPEVNLPAARFLGQVLKHLSPSTVLLALMALVGLTPPTEVALLV